MFTRLILALFLAVSCFGQITKNVVTDFGGTCNGSANDAAAFASANTFALTWQMSNPGLRFNLTAPDHSHCVLGSGATRFFKDINYPRFFGTDVTLSGALYLGGNSEYPDNLHDARTATVASGATSVTLLTPAQASRFTVGAWALVTGLDLQGYGFPTNPAFFDYVCVAGANVSTGVVKFDGTGPACVGQSGAAATPLTHIYKSTWPLYSAGDSGTPDYGGPATIYALDPSFNTDIIFEGIGGTNITLDGPTQIYAPGYNATFINVYLANVVAISPTAAGKWTATNLTTVGGSDIEIDKLVGSLSFTNSALVQMEAQSMGVKTLTLANTSITTLNGTPYSTTISGGSNVGTLEPGVTAYGVASSLTCANSTVSAITPKGVADTGMGSGVNVLYSMTAGVIRSANANGPLPWAVPGALMFWYGQYLNEGVPFTVVDLTQDGTYTYVQTSLAGTFPTIPQDSGKIYLHAQPSPQTTFTSCTGSADTLDVSQAPPGQPIYSYSKRTFTGSVQISPLAPVWGQIVSIKINVTKAYTGTQGTLTLNAGGLFHTVLVDGSGAQVLYAPVINVKTTGERDIFPSSVTGTQTGDSGLALGGLMWMTEGYAPSFSSDISMESSGVWPSVTIEIITSQTQQIPSTGSGHGGKKALGGKKAGQ